MSDEKDKTANNLFPPSIEVTVVYEQPLEYGRGRAAGRNKVISWEPKTKKQVFEISDIIKVVSENKAATRGQGSKRFGGFFLDDNTGDPVDTDIIIKAVVHAHVPGGICSTYVHQYNVLETAEEIQNKIDIAVGKTPAPLTTEQELRKTVEELTSTVKALQEEVAKQTSAATPPKGPAR